jgi:hypothetical protein
MKLLIYLYLRRNGAYVNINISEAPVYAFMMMQAVLEMRQAQQSNELHITMTYMLQKDVGKIELDKISEVLTEIFLGRKLFVTEGFA